MGEIQTKRKYATLKQTNNTLTGLGTRSDIKSRQSPRAKRMAGGQVLLALRHAVHGRGAQPRPAAGGHGSTRSSAGVWGAPPVSDTRPGLPLHVPVSALVRPARLVLGWTCLLLFYGPNWATQPRPGSGRQTEGPPGVGAGRESTTDTSPTIRKVIPKDKVRCDSANCTQVRQPVHEKRNHNACGRSGGRIYA